MALFELGRTVATPAALKFCKEHNISPLHLLHRHANGDWGDLGQEDLRANKEAVAYGARIFSSYKVGNEKVWIITEADRSGTTVLLPSEY